MEGASDVAARFDRIAAQYDETREQLMEEALDRVAAILHRDGVHSILEVGVGTGRIALPLQERHFDVTGLDLSPAMLSKAKAKGVARLVMAEADNPPFKSKEFDAVILVHVLQLLDAPTQTFQNLTKVAKKEVAVFLRKPAASCDGANEAREEFYRAFGATAKELGVALGDRYERWHGRYARQDDFLEKFPPDERITIQEKDYSESFRGYIAVMEPGNCSFTADVSEQEFERIIERIKLTTNLDQEFPYHRVDQMLIWHLG